MASAVIVEAVRTPVGKRGGVLAGVHPAQLLGGVQAALLDRADLAPAAVLLASPGRARSLGLRPRRASSRSAWSAPRPTTTWTGRSKRPSGCWPAAA
jgi:acetyl-CoA C-acetyltransferase